MEVIIDPRTYRVSKLSPTLIAKVAEKMRLNPRLKPPRAKKKWSETVDMDGERFVVMCHEESGVAVITNIRRAKKKRGQPWRR